MFTLCALAPMVALALTIALAFVAAVALDARQWRGASDATPPAVEAFGAAGDPWGLVLADIGGTLRPRPNAARLEFAAYPPMLASAAFGMCWLEPIPGETPAPLPTECPVAAPREAFQCHDTLPDMGGFVSLLNAPAAPSGKLWWADTLPSVPCVEG